MVYKWKTAMCHLVWLFMCLTRNAGAIPLCPYDQYRVGERCCYSCDPGRKVYKDCTTRQTYCTPCDKGTFQEGFNGKKYCTSCTRCDEERGLRLKKSCTKTSDALCEPLDGYFCSDPIRDGCMEAQSHSVSCTPGHHISQTGTPDKDIECLKCSYGTFSEGTSTSCQPHTICESLELDQIKAGTDSTDSECGEQRSHLIPVVMGIMSFIVVALIIVVILVMRRKPDADEIRGTFSRCPRTGSGSSVIQEELRNSTVTTSNATLHLEDSSGLLQTSTQGGDVEN